MIPVRGFEGKTVAVFGLARTGLTAARALVAGGAEVALWDDNPKTRAAAEADGFKLTDLTKADWSDFAAIMLSPGVPLTHPRPHWTVDMANAAGVEILGDVELFARTVNAVPEHKRPRIVAITGTNGKSTTTALIGHVCAQAGRDVRIGGNIGIGAVAVATRHEIVLGIIGGLFVAELLSVVIQVAWFKRTGRRIFLMAPIHHHFEKLGWSESTVVIRFWIVSIMLALVGLATLKLR